MPSRPIAARPRGAGRLDAATVRTVSRDLANAASARQTSLTKLLRAAATEHGGVIAEGRPLRASKGALRRLLEAKLACNLALSSDDVAGTVHDALDYALILPDASYAEAIDDTLERLAADGCEVLSVNNYLDWPTADGIDAVVAAGAPGNRGPDATAPGTPGAFKFRLRFHTAVTWHAQQQHHLLHEEIRALRHGAEAVGQDFGGGEPVEMYWFADVYEDLGHPADAPAGLYLMLGTDEAQVALYLDEAGWKPSSEVEYWIATGEPSVTPIDETAAADVLAAWGVDDDMVAWSGDEGE